MWNFLIPALGAIGGILGGASRGASAGRQQTTQNNATQDNQRTSQYGINQQALLAALQAAENANVNRAGVDLQQRQFALNAPSARMGQATRGSMLANAQDVQVSHPRANIPTITGGARPSALTPEARQLGALISRQALMNQMSGDNFSPIPQQDWQSGVLPPPGVTPQPQAGWLEKIGGVAGILGSGVQGIQQAITQQANQRGPWSGVQTPQQGGWTLPQF